MRTVICSLLAAVLVVGFGWADEPAKPAQKDAPPANLKSLTEEFQQALSKLQKEFQAAQEIEAKTKIRDQAIEMLGKFANRAIDYAEKNPKSEDAPQALIMSLQWARDEATRDRAVLVLIKDHAESKAIGQICTMLAELPNPVVEKLLRTVMEKNPDRNAQGLATLALATHLQSRAEDARGAEAEKLTKEAEKVLEVALAKYADVKTADGTVGEEAKAALSLAVGREVPDIVGADSEDKEFKLSDYRGKVVMLDFWASWCGPCMAMVPHNRELVTKMKGRPFALIGVNADQDKDAFKKAESDKKMNYRSFYDGDGKIVGAWRIKAFPTMLLIDHKGVMRQKIVGGGPANMKALDEAIEKLVAEAEADAKK
ncbi:MAG: TlpA family protein disulfide reductase [Gemmatales bacterium]|nr:TlpA family protein disulfide reductase [Gemmatales bacterium]MDW8387375.1 TlpA disulfide reductase family protein [Gemmatales bacterium]